MSGLSSTRRTALVAGTANLFVGVIKLGLVLAALGLALRQLTGSPV
ncbi:MAG TPA: hypothetical protein VH307_15975 [Streptosporangiaceae bacterium]|nr:hypothetical protein [Streptosporangiaceae bacterium]